jgi:hypothetical protein
MFFEPRVEHYIYMEKEFQGLRANQLGFDFQTLPKLVPAWDDHRTQLVNKHVFVYKKIDT